MVKDIMTTDVTVVHPDAPVREAAELMERLHHRSLPVVDDEGRLVGIISELVLLRIALPSYTDNIPNLSFLPETDVLPAERVEDLTAAKVKDVMQTEDLPTATEEMPIAEAAHIMLTHGINTMPVVREGKLVGVVSTRDLVREIVHSKLQSGSQQ